MTISLTIPRLEMSMTEGMLAEWLVADGEDVEQGQPIYVLETDKAAQEIESPGTGKLVHVCAAGETYPVGDEIGRIT